MNLRSKRQIAASTFKVGKERIVFVRARLEDIKEAITKQDMRDLHADGAIRIKEVSGRKTNTKRKTRRSTGNIRKKVNTRKQDYVIMTRKLRRYTAEMKNQGKLSPEEVKEIRNRIRNRMFKSKANLKDYIENKDSVFAKAGAKKHVKKKKKTVRKKK